MSVCVCVSLCACINHMYIQGVKQPTGLELVRCVATARIAMPKSMVRLSAGRLGLSIPEQVFFLFS